MSVGCLRISLYDFARSKLGMHRMHKILCLGHYAWIDVVGRYVSITDCGFGIR